MCTRVGYGGWRHCVQTSLPPFPFPPVPVLPHCTHTHTHQLGLLYNPRWRRAQQVSVCCSSVCSLHLRTTCDSHSCCTHARRLGLESAYEWQKNFTFYEPSEPNVFNCGYGRWMWWLFWVQLLIHTKVAAPPDVVVNIQRLCLSAGNEGGRNIQRERLCYLKCGFVGPLTIIETFRSVLGYPPLSRAVFVNTRNENRLILVCVKLNSQLSIKPGQYEQ